MRRPGNRGGQSGGLDQVFQRDPGGPGEHLAERPAGGRPDGDGRAGEHDPDRRGQGQQVGRDCGQLQALEGVGDDRRDHEAGGGGDGQGFGGEAGQAGTGCEPLRHTRRDDDKAERAGEGELKADVGQGGRVDENDRERRHRQSDQRVGVAAEQPGQQDQFAHQGGAHDAGLAAGQGGVEGQGQHGQQDAVAADEPAGHAADGQGDEGDVEAGDGDDVDQAGGQEVGAQVARAGWSACRPGWRIAGRRGVRAGRRARCGRCDRGAG